MFKTNQLFLVSALLMMISFALTGCGGSTTTVTTNTENKATNTVATKPTEANTNTKPADNTAKPADNKSQTASTDKIGVPECDEYIEKYEACLFSKVPEAQRGMFKSSFDQARKTWKESASNPQAKAALATGCKTALETAKTSMSSFGCKWD